MRDVSTAATAEGFWSKKSVISHAGDSPVQPMTRFLGSIVAIALLAAGSARAQVYKWVDDRGVVNYSSQPPGDRKSRVLDPNSVSVSIYEAPTAAEDASLREKALVERIASLERRLDAERNARQSLARPEATAMDIQYERCLRDRRIDCDSSGLDPYAPYGPTVVVVLPHRHARPPGPRRVIPPMFAPPLANHRVNAAARTPPSGTRRPHARTGDLL